MRDLRQREKPSIPTEHMGFVLTPRGQTPDMCIRLLGAAKGSLAIFDNPKTTTLNISFLDGREAEVRQLFESVQLDDDDFFFSVSVPYVDKYDFLRKVHNAHKQLTN